MVLQEITEDRIDMLKENIVAIVEERFCKSIEAISNYVYDNDEAEVQYFTSVITGLYEKALDAQTRGTLGEISCIFISYLRAGVMDGKLELQLRIMDEKGYAGDECVDVIWKPTFIRDYFQKDVEFMIAGLKNRMFRLTTREESIARYMFASDYYKIVLKYLIVFIDAFQFNILLIQLQTEEEISLLFGEMCDSGTEIYSFSKLGE